MPCHSGAGVPHWPAGSAMPASIPSATPGWPSRTGSARRRTSRTQCRTAEAVVVSCPSHAMRALGEQIRPLLHRDALIVSRPSRGSSRTRHRTMSGDPRGGAARARDPGVGAVGPELRARGGARHADGGDGGGERPSRRRGAPASVHTGRRSASTPRPTWSGVEIGGAVKNIIALAAGVSDGLGFGHNTRAALITRGLAEISRLAIQLGADPARCTVCPASATWC